MANLFLADPGVIDPLLWLRVVVSIDGLLQLSLFLDVKYTALAQTSAFCQG